MKIDLGLFSSGLLKSGKKNHHVEFWSLIVVSRVSLNEKWDFIKEINVRNSFCYNFHVCSVNISPLFIGFTDDVNFKCYIYIIFNFLMLLLILGFNL